MLALLAFVAATGLTSPAPALAVTGQCKWVQGRFVIYNGSSLRRIWLVGSTRIVALRDDDDHVPPEIARYQRDATEHDGKKDGLFGSFYICAREKSRAGRMQHVRLLKTRHLICRGKPFAAR